MARTINYWDRLQADFQELAAKKAMDPHIQEDAVYDLYRALEPADQEALKRRINRYSVARRNVGVAPIPTDNAS